MKKTLFLTCLGLAAVGTFSALGCGGGGGTPTPTPDPTITPTPPPVPTPTPTPTPPGGGVPAAPTNFTASVTGTQARLAWRDNANNETGYRIERNLSDTGWSELRTVAANTQSATVTGLQRETSYQFRVLAVNAAGASAPSNEAGGTTASVDQANHTPASPYSPRYASLLAERIIWGNRAITYSISPGTETRNPALLLAAIQKAFHRWSVGTNGLLTFTKVDSGANIPITFVPAGDPELTEGVGSAIYTFSPGSPRSTFVSAQIKLQAGLPEGQLIAIAAHEIGHALGITGHSDVPADVMFPTVDPDLPVSARDANTLAFLYNTTDRD